MKIEKLDLSNYLKELEYLVNIDSVSSDSVGTTKIAKFMMEKYKALGWNTKNYTFNDTIGPCLEITNTLATEYDVLLLAHMDTVFPLGTAKERPFSIKENRAYGPGVNDCKAGLLSGFYALVALEKAGCLIDKKVCVFLNSDHEIISSRYSKHHLEDLAKKSKCTIVLEAGRANGNLVNKRKGIGRYHIKIDGVAAHSGINPKDGRNAIEEIAHWVLTLQSRTDYAKETTLNIGKISGGISISSVPAHAEAELDIRFYDKSEAASIESLLQHLVENPHVEGTRAEITGEVTRPAMIPSDTTKELCQVIDKIGKLLQINFAWEASGGGSDGSFSAAVGTPTVDALGPVGGNAHSPQEYLEIDTIIPRYKLLCEVIFHLVNHKVELP